MSGVFVNGYLHWIFDSHSKPVIVAFSLADEKLSELPPPILYNEVDIVSDFDTKLVALGEKLAIFHELKGDVWLMDEYGVQKSWTKIVVHGFNEIPLIRPDVFSNNRKFLFLTSSVLWIYDVEERTFCESVDISCMNIRPGRLAEKKDLRCQRFAHIIQRQRTDTAYLLLYVDDIVLTASSEGLLQRIIRSLHQEFAMTDLGPLNYFLGVSVTRDSSGVGGDPFSRVLRIMVCSYFLHLPHIWLLILMRIGLGVPLLRDKLPEAEYRGVANVVVETCWLRNLLHTAITKAGIKLLLHRAQFSCSWDTLGISTLKASVADA
ncbi:F-box associated domain containing protein [Tanacetum coccineum]